MSINIPEVTLHQFRQYLEREKCTVEQVGRGGEDYVFLIISIPVDLDKGWKKEIRDTILLYISNYNERDNGHRIAGTFYYSSFKS